MPKFSRVGYIIVGGFVVLLLAGCPKEFSYNPQDPHPDNESYMTATPALTQTLTPTSTNTPIPPYEIFVTLGNFLGEFNGMPGLGGADGRCQQAADTAGIGISDGGRIWKAILSNGTPIHAKDRLIDFGPWHLVDGGPAGGGPKVFDSIIGPFPSIVTDPAVAINRDENGDPVSGGTLVWTGSNFGATAAPTDCTDWTINTLGTFGGYGVVSNTTTWINAGSNNCDVSGRLYCVEQ